MLKLLKYLKKSIPVIILVIALLALQAVMELSLPSFTSDIVDIGIQQGGISEHVPSVIRETEMNKLGLFMSEEDLTTVKGYYRLLKKDFFDEDRFNYYKEKYPIIASENLYELRTNSESDLNIVQQLIAKPMLMLYSFSGDSEESQKAQDEIKANLPKEIQNADIFTILSAMPAESRIEMMNAMTKKLDAMPDSILKQSSVIYIRSEYDTIGLNVNKIQITYIVTVGLKMLGVALLSMLAAILVSLCSARIGAGFARDMRSKVFSKVVSFTNTEFDKFSTASLITRSTNDIQQVQMLITMGLRLLCYAPIMAIGGVVMVLRTNTSMAWIIAIAVLAIITVVFSMYTITMPKFKSMQKLVDKLNLVMREILTGLPVIRAFSTQKHEEKRFSDANTDLTKTSLFVNRIMSGMMPAMMLIMNAVTILIMWNGAHGIDSGSMQVGDLMAFIQYTMQIIMSFLMISMMSIMIPRASVSGERISEILETKLVINDAEQPKKFNENSTGTVEFHDVSFRYPSAEADVIENISFTAKAGETTAIIGSTGCGKSTIINLIPRLYDVTGGYITVDGIDIREVSQHDLRDKIGFVPQKGVLFSGTIESNLRYGKHLASNVEIENAAQIAQAHEFIIQKDNKYESEISQGGTNVSGGQKQRLAIARAIVKNPDIYIFDDSFSALDYKTDVVLRRELKKYTKNAAVIIVAQRISTILHAEQIVVLDDGKIVGKGTHKSLLENCEVYRQIASSQLSKEELDHE